MADADSVLTSAANGLRLAVRLQPAARQARIARPVCLDDGSFQLRVWVTEAAEKGRANAALLKLLSKTLKLPKSAFSIISGKQNRRKVVGIEGDAEELLPRLASWIKSLPDA